MLFRSARVFCHSTRNKIVWEGSHYSWILKAVEWEVMAGLGVSVTELVEGEGFAYHRIGLN